MTWDPLLAVEFLTVARVRRFGMASPAAMARSQAFYPLVGLGLGGVLVAADGVLGGTLPAASRSAVLVALLAALTRGLHLDGLADSFDGLLGGRDRARRLEIMRDPRIGSFGATALALVLLLKWSALAELDSPLRWPSLLLVPALARFAMVVCVAAAPYARSDGLGAGYRAAARGAPMLIAAALATVSAVVLLGPGGAALVLVAVAVALAMAWWAWRAVGGGTGDIYGATCELSESTLLLVLVAAQVHGWLDPWLVRG